MVRLVGDDRKATAALITAGYVDDAVLLRMKQFVFSKAASQCHINGV